MYVFVCIVHTYIITTLLVIAERPSWVRWLDSDTMAMSHRGKMFVVQ